MKKVILMVSAVFCSAYLMAQNAPAAKQTAPASTVKQTPVATPAASHVTPASADKKAVPATTTTDSKNATTSKKHAVHHSHAAVAPKPATDAAAPVKKEEPKK